MNLIIESAGQPQPGRDLTDLWVDVTGHVAGLDPISQLIAALGWVKEGQVIRVTVDPRPALPCFCGADELEGHPCLRPGCPNS